MSANSCQVSENPFSISQQKKQTTEAGPTLSISDVCCAHFFCGFQVLALQLTETKREYSRLLPIATQGDGHKLGDSRGMGMRVLEETGVGQEGSQRTPDFKRTCSRPRTSELQRDEGKHEAPTWAWLELKTRWN